MRDGDKVLMGFFVDLSALLESDGFPDEFKSVVKAGKDDPNWTPFLVKCRTHIRGLVRIYRGEDRVDYSIHFPKAEKDGRLNEKKRDFVEIRAEVDRKDSQIGLALNPSIEAVRVGVLRLQGNKVFMLNKEKLQSTSVARPYLQQSNKHWPRCSRDWVTKAQCSM